MDSTMSISNTYQPISDAYDGKCVFVTGGTGFLGKVFVEKLIYRCPKIAKVYVLLRDTEKASAEEKLENMLDCPLFKRLKEERPQDLQKIIPIKGDISEPNLGINNKDENILIDQVSMVFHFAATIKFNDPLHVTFNINVEGTRRILDLSAKMRNLQVFVYVSTAFSNAIRKVIDEVVYPPIIPLSEIDTLVKQKTVTPEQTKRIMKGMPNTYTISKNLAESVVAEFQKNHSFPMVIVRPSIVISCKDEPLKGWIDNWFGPTAVMEAIRHGVIKTIYSYGNNVIDLIPVDYVANLVIIAGARCRSVDHVEVYNSCSSSVNPITLRQFTDYIQQDSNKLYTKLYPFPRPIYIKYRWLVLIVQFLLETIPTYLASFVSLIIGKKNKYLKILSRVNGIREAFFPFTSRTWMIYSHNTSALAKTLSPHDSCVFACDATTIDWNEYVPVYLQGIQDYLLPSKK